MNCLFCRIVAGEIPATFVYQDDLMVAFRDIEPQAPTHVLIVPRQHIVSVAEMTEADAALGAHLLLVAGQIAQAEGVAESGFRVVSNSGREGGQSVFHLHLHVLGGRKLSGQMG